MSKNSEKPVASSPERHTFQAEAMIKRSEERSDENNEQYLKYWEDARSYDREKIHDPIWQKDNMEYDLRSTDWIVEKARASDSYAQNIYAALCNNDFMKLAVVPILKEQTWSCSWRHAGGVVADMLGKGDYIDWYCSGMGDGLGNGDPDGNRGYFPEGHITEEIKQDLQKLGWVIVTKEEKEY